MRKEKEIHYRKLNKEGKNWMSNYKSFKIE